jgi:signal transduction histidine kinase
LWKNPAERDELVRIIEEKGFCENFEALFCRKDGVEFTGLLSAKTLLINNEPHLISVTRNIADRILAEEEIRFKNEELKKVNAEKDKFFSIIAHDLRSPFNGFLGLTELLARNSHVMAPVDIEQISINMRQSAGNIYSLLENLLEWSLMEQGLVVFKPSVYPLNLIIDESLIPLADSAHTKQIEIKYTIPQDFHVFADRNMIQTVIRNLVSNAVKFTPEKGKINLSVRVTEAGFVEIAIQDSGIGMSPQIIENLFKIDKKTNRKGTQGEPSTGLGLIICHDFIEKHGGKIRAESEVGKGSVFYISIPGLK